MPRPDLLSPPARRRLRVLAWRVRRPLAALCVGLAALLAVDLVRPAGPPTVRVLAAARDLPAGAVLTAADLAPVDVPAGVLPQTGGAGAVAGRRLAVAVPAGFPLVPQLLVEEDGSGPPGTVVVPVRFADAGVADVLRTGMRVDVVAAPLLDGGEPARLAAGAVVLAPPRADDPGPAGGGLLGTSGAPAESAPVLLAVSPEESVALSGATASRALSAVIVG